MANPELTDAQYTAIVQCVERSVSNPQLRLELIDHCCCCIEEMMADGNSFEQSLENALQLLHPNGLDYIEKAIQNTVNPLIPHTMKTTLYLSGFVASFGIVLGITMKQLQWPGANMMLAMGDLALIICMFSVLITQLWIRHLLKPLYFLRSVAGALGGLFVGMGGFFKIMYWPTANMQFLLGTLVLAFVFLPLLFWQLYQREMQGA